MNPILLPFPPLADTLHLYYDLQEAGLPCMITSTPDPGLRKFEPQQAPSGADQSSHFIHKAEITAFVAGWVACYNREELHDVAMKVSRVPKQEWYKHSPGQSS